MEFSFKDLSNKTVPQLRKIAGELEDKALKGYSKLPKQQLLEALCQALGIEDSAAPAPQATKKEAPATEAQEEEAPAPEAAEEAAPATEPKEKEAPAPEVAEEAAPAPEAAEEVAPAPEAAEVAAPATEPKEQEANPCCADPSPRTPTHGRSRNRPMNPQRWHPPYRAWGPRNYYRPRLVEREKTVHRTGPRAATDSWPRGRERRRRKELRCRPAPGLKALACAQGKIARPPDPANRDLATFRVG
ncbi:MAG: Rho termination factor N-terminal domain-containing protein [Acidobacteria bacterium]|nr:Rho termination factor N-terminal domain-containing protein [Acidobacteriota bacterium]